MGDIINMEECPIPKTPQQVSIDRGGVKRPNRMSLLIAGKSNLFNTGDSDFNFVSTPEHVRNKNGNESPAQVNPIDLVHQISDLQKALRTVTNELDYTKKLLAVESKKRRELESTSSPTSISEPFINFNNKGSNYTNSQQEIGIKILNGVSKMATGINELQESIKLSLSMSFTEEEEDVHNDNTNKKKNNKSKKNSKGNNTNGGNNNNSNNNSNDAINGSQQSANTTRSTYPAENDVKNQINSFQKSLKNPTGTPSSRKSSYSLHPDVFCGHGTPAWCTTLQIGDKLDARDSNRKWYKSVIVDKKYEGSTCKIKIHFIGWNEDWDLWMDTTLDIANLAPSGVHTEEEHDVVKKDHVEESSKEEETVEVMLNSGASSKQEENDDDDDDDGNTSSKLQSHQDDDDRHQSHSPGGMEISLSPVIIARTPSNNYRSTSITYV